ncbi:transmembrane protein 150C [Carcharodon carcharias]|uniref:transmembrane protein 150C n=1 Tax=Carcharodon carcharias TaxID=13397 RepID=UPI001B7D9290|nr:transmembrane protein 150C [Carcharodon carcharias]
MTRAYKINGRTRRSVEEQRYLGVHVHSTLKVAGKLNKVVYLHTVLFIAILRYTQLKSKVEKPWLNILGLLAQSTASIGMTLVANFQLSEDERIHNTGTILIFGFGTMVCWIQVVLTFQANIHNEGFRVGILRGMLATAISINIILYFFLVAQHKYLHGARAQWTLIMIFLLFIGTFAIEFRHSEFTIRCGDGQNRSVSTVIAEFHPDHISHCTNTSPPSIKINGKTLEDVDYIPYIESSLSTKLDMIEKFINASNMPAQP